MIPVPPSAKPVAFYDTECYPNYWLLKFRPQGGQPISFALRAGEAFTEETLGKIAHLFFIFKVISFNGIYYDVPMISAALNGFRTEQLKWLNDQIIVEKRKPWELNLPSWQPADHIDIMEVLPGSGSQKTYAGRIHCKRMLDLPYEPNQYLTEVQISEVDSYCGNDLDVLEELFVALAPLIAQREDLSERYGVDLRSTSDAQLAEKVIKKRCEEALGQRIFKPEIDWNLRFRYEAPRFLSFQSPSLQTAFQAVKDSIFSLGLNGSVVMPHLLDGLEVTIGKSVYRMGIGGLHSKEKTIAHRSDEFWILRDIDVESYYPNLILNSGKYPAALGPMFLKIFALMKDERLTAKQREKELKKLGDIYGVEFLRVHSDNEGGKIMINGTFGKTNSPFSVLFAPEMFIQTTVTGQLSLLMLIEWHELQGIQVVSANTDGIVIKCSRSQLAISENIVAYWEKATGLKMEASEYTAIYSKDVNNYFAVKPSGEVKRKGEYSKAGLIEKKNPDVEICSDAVATFLADGTPMLYTVAVCRDIRKFVTMQKVTGGGVKLWGEDPRSKLVRDMIPTIQANGWLKEGRKWIKDGLIADPTTAYKSCFAPQRPEYLGKVIRWYYSTEAPGPIIYKQSGNHVGLSYGAMPCMTLPDEFPSDIDYKWYLDNCESILKDVGYYADTEVR